MRKLPLLHSEDVHFWHISWLFLYVPSLLFQIARIISRLYVLLWHGIQGQDVVRRKERNARAAENGDRIVEVVKPLGCILEEDKNGGNMKMKMSMLLDCFLYQRVRHDVMLAPTHRRR